MNDDRDPTGYFILGILDGIFWFFQGFRLYRKYRIVADTPVIPIRSAAMGLVEVHGTACDGELVKSPVSGSSCFYSKVKIEAWVVNANGNGEWRQVATGTKGQRFYLGDETGKILVDPAGAEMDLKENCQAVAGQVVSNPRHPPRHTSGPNSYLSGGILTLFPKDTAPAPTPTSSLSEDELLEYVKGVVSRSAAGQKDFRGMYRLTEYCIVPGLSYDITATCSENPSPRDLQDHNLLNKGENEPTFLISSRSEKDLLMNLRKRALRHILGGSLLAIASLALLLVTHGRLTR
jgi:hypothetical protein